MAKHVLYNAVVTLNSVTITDHITKISWVAGINKQAAAAMSEVQDYSMPGTIVISPITLEGYQDYAGSNIYATVQALIAARSSVTLTAKADSAADSATNPNFTISVFVGQFTYLDGDRGSAHMFKLTLEPAGAITYDVT